MEKKVVIRDYSAADRKALESIICKTWHYEQFCSPGTAKRLAGLYLASCLCNQTFVRVAEVDGLPAGVIMGKDCKAHRTPVRYRLRQAAAAASLCMRSEGRRIARAFSGIEKVDRELSRERGREYPGELAFFAVDETCRGQGIGKKLFDAVVSYMKERNLDSFCLYTDNSCNFGFYEHQGMTRCGKNNYKVPISVRNEMEFYLYEYQIV